MKKLLIIIIFIILSISVYYFYATYPLKKTWDYAQKVMSCEIEPENTSPIRFLYDHKLMFPNTDSIGLKTRRYFVSRFGEKAHWIVHYQQFFYDATGNLINCYSDDVVFNFEYNGREWVITEINVYT